MLTSSSSDDLRWDLRVRSFCHESLQPLSLLAKGGLFCLVRHLGHRIYAREPVGSTLIFAGDAKLHEPAQDDVESSTRQLFDVRNHSGAADRINRRPSSIVRFVSWLQRRHPDDAVTLQRISHHRAIARFEDVQRPRDAREEHRHLEREDWNHRRELVQHLAPCPAAGIAPGQCRQPTRDWLSLLRTRVSYMAFVSPFGHGASDALGATG